MSSTSRPLSLFIPTTWSQQQQQQSSSSNTRPSSIQSTSSSIALNSPSWSNLSFDQISLYARRASNSSISILTTHQSEQEEKRRKRQRDKVQQGKVNDVVMRCHGDWSFVNTVVNGFTHILLLSLNDCSLGFYRISDHIHRKVPRIVDTKKQLQQSKAKVDIAISDIQDVRKNVCDIERIESFYNINKMIESSINILKNSKKWGFHFSDGIKDLDGIILTIEPCCNVCRSPSRIRCTAFPCPMVY